MSEYFLTGCDENFVPPIPYFHDISYKPMPHTEACGVYTVRT